MRAAGGSDPLTITIVIRDLPARARLRSLIQALSEDLAGYFRSLRQVEWDLEAEDRGVVARCRVRAQSGLYRAHARAEHAGQALDEVFEKIVKQRRRKKRLRLSKRRKSASG